MNNIMSSAKIEREQALKWWNTLSFEDKFYKTIGWLSDKGLNTTDKHPDRLVDREIHEMFKHHKNPYLFENLKASSGYDVTYDYPYQIIQSLIKGEVVYMKNKQADEFILYLKVNELFDMYASTPSTDPNKTIFIHL